MPVRSTVKSESYYDFFSNSGKNTDAFDYDPPLVIDPWFGNRGVIHGGGISPFNPGLSNIIQYVTITSTGSATDFGDLPKTLQSMAGVSNSSRGVSAGGKGPGGNDGSNSIQYVTIANTGNTTDFGDLTVAGSGQGDAQYITGVSNSTRGLIAGLTSSNDGIDYITIANTGNASSFGNLSVARRMGGSGSNGIKAVFGGGGSSNPGSDVIDYVTMATTGNAVDYGNLTQNRRYCSGTSNKDRTLFMGGSVSEAWDGVNTIDYIEINSSGNATDFGDLTLRRYGPGCFANSTRALAAGGSHPAADVIDYVTISSTGNATDFGDLLNGTAWATGCCSGN